MYINYDHYRIFYYVAKYGNVSQAAKLLLNNQPNLTRTIKTLEGELGCPLFLRTNRGMRLTPEGEKLFAHVRIAFEHLEAGEAEILESRNLQSGTVFVAATETALRCLLPPVLKRYRTLYPGVHFRINNYSTPQAIAALKDGTADLAVVTTPTVHSASLTEQEIKTITEVAVCSPAFTALTGRSVSLKELVEYPLISLGSDTKSYEFYGNLFTRCGLPYHPDIEACSSIQIMLLAAYDLGVGFVPKEFVRPEDGVAVIDLKEEIPTRSVCLIKRKEQSLSIAARELERMILETAK